MMKTLGHFKVIIKPLNLLPVEFVTDKVRIDHLLDDLLVRRSIFKWLDSQYNRKNIVFLPIVLSLKKNLRIK
jgi:hypothetical protein